MWSRLFCARLASLTILLRQISRFLQTDGGMSGTSTTSPSSTLTGGSSRSTALSAQMLRKLFGLQAAESLKHEKEIHTQICQNRERLYTSRRGTQQEGTQEKKTHEGWAAAGARQHVGDSEEVDV
eukprot:m.80088 g.80088  ORF g.80088 m.80088 type:complete len:125 (+) comp8198_c1_seq1:80-454(+)